MATERIQIIISSKGAVTVKREIDEIGNSAKKSTAGVDMLKSALATLTAYLGVREVIAYADSYVRLQNSLQIAGREGENLSSTQEKLRQIANRNGVEVESLARVYSRAAIAGKELGANEEKLQKLSSGVAAAIKLTGQSASEVRGPMLQLAQALGSPIVRAEEFNSIMEGMLPVAQAAARGIDGFDGSVSKLRTAIVNGNITNKQFFDGLLKGFQDTERLAAKMSLTIGQSLTVLNNNLTFFFGQTLVGTGLLNALSGAIILVANNLGFVVAALTPVIAALIFMAGQMVLGLVITAYKDFMTILNTQVIPTLVRLNAVLWANPYLLIAAAILAVVAAVIYWRKELGITDAMLKNIWQTGVAAFNAVWNVIIEGWKIVKPLFEAWYGLWMDIAELIGTTLMAALTALWNWLKPFFRDVLEGWEKIYGWLVYIDSFVTGALTTAFKNFFANFIADIKGVIQWIIDWINYLRKVIALAKQAFGGGGGGGGVGAGAGAPGMREGGQFMVGGTGSGTDTTPVRFNANRGERVTVETRKQQRENDRAPAAASAAGDVQVPVSIVNVMDPKMIPMAMESAEGQRSFINNLKANRDEALAVLGVA